MVAVSAILSPVLLWLLLAYAVGKGKRKVVAVPVVEDVTAQDLS